MGLRRARAGFVELFGTVLGKEGSLGGKLDMISCLVAHTTGRV